LRLPGIDDPRTPYGLIRAVADCLDDQATITTDVGQHQMWVAQAYPLRRPRQWLTSGGLGTMGFGMPAAIGAALAEPERTVVCFTGDGSILMNVQELVTAAEEKVNVKIVLMNNSSLGLVFQQQTMFYGERIYASKFKGMPDFVRVAEGFRGVGHRPRYGKRSARGAGRSSVCARSDADTRQHRHARTGFADGAARCRQQRHDRRLKAMNSISRTENQALARTVLELDVYNHPGVMSHVVGLFSRRAYNVEGILVMPVGSGVTSRIWLLVNEDERLDQMVKQVEKLEDVLAVRRHGAEHEVFVRLEEFFR
jgi:acetolactate synthase regulatory subunit